MFLKKLLPDYYFSDIYSIPENFFDSNGIRGIICDIDNTLVTYDDPEPTPKLLCWMERLTSSGIQISFISNNNKQRVEEFNRKLGYYAAYKSGKPSRREIFSAMKHMGTTKENTISIGDQLFTDVLASKRAGIKAILVYPIKDKKTLFFRFKRLLEKPFLRWFRRIGSGK